jgi:acetoin utilization deacetylase AcuC-like enzyme
VPGYEFGLGGMLEAIDQMRRGAIDRASCFSLGGHHAYPDWGHGYCLLNPLAAAVRYAQAHGFRRALLLDWDIHHGDGAQAIFANDPSVYCLSVHSAIDLYMAKVADWRAGMPSEGARVGHANLPVIHELLEEKREAYQHYGRILRGEEAIPAFREALAALPFRPELIGVFSGYDGHKDDCGRRITNWTESDFEELTRLTLEVAERAGCPLLSVHGGRIQPANGAGVGGLSRSGTCGLGEAACLTSHLPRSFARDTQPFPWV